MMRIETLYHQRVLMEKLFAGEELPLLKIRWGMESILPSKFATDAPIGKEELKNALLSGGALAYNRLVTVLEKESFSELAQLLNSHGVQELYRYIWIWSTDGSIMRCGESWYTSKARCLFEGQHRIPSYCTFDGPGAPEAVLCVESICPCHVHLVSQARAYAKGVLSLPCRCFNEQMLTKQDKNGGSFILRPPKMKINSFSNGQQTALGQSFTQHRG